MKTLLTLFVILFMSTFSFGQICNPPSDIVYELVGSNEIKVTLKNDCDLEIGYLKIVKDDKLIRHGIWKSFCKGNLVMTAKYKNGKMKWIKTDKQSKITNNEIVYLRSLKQDNTVLAEHNELDQ